MISKKCHRLIQLQLKRLHRHAKHIYYIPLISLLAFLDNFLIVIPNDGILISSSMLVPKRWHWFAIFMAIGSSLGALLFALLVKQEGLPLILKYYPGIDQLPVWSLSENFLEKYGLLFVFLIGISPIMQHPVIILAALAHIPLFNLGVAILFGRILKFLLLGYIASHAPKYLNRLFFRKGESYV